MTAAFLTAIADHLTTAGVVGGAMGWTVSKLQHADDANDIAILPAGGPEPALQAQRRVLNPRFQCQVRGTAGAVGTAYNKAVEVLETLDGAVIDDSASPATFVFDHLHVTQSAPLNVGPDEADRPLFTVDFRAQEA